MTSNDIDRDPCLDINCGRMPRYCYNTVGWTVNQIIDMHEYRKPGPTPGYPGDNCMDICEFTWFYMCGQVLHDWDPISGTVIEDLFTEYNTDNTDCSNCCLHPSELTAMLDVIGFDDGTVDEDTPVELVDDK